MPLNQIIGWASFLLVGFTMGLLGGGGAILTVPILVYLFNVPPTKATGLSLFVVGATALVGAVDSARRGLVDLAGALWFALPSIAGVLLARTVVVPSIPDPVVPGLAKDRATMAFFGLLLLAVGLSMLLRKRPEAAEKKGSVALMATLGATVGILSGLVGAGGGFLIVPALALVAAMDMKVAVGTSMAVISAQSLIGFAGEAVRSRQVDWTFLSGVTAVALLGLGLGALVSRRVKSQEVQKVFGVFVLVMALVLLGHEAMNP